MKIKLNKINLYPTITIISLFIIFSFSYKYLLSEANEIFIADYKNFSNENSILLKKVVEELSYNKRYELIQREVTRLSTRKNIKHVLIVSLDETILYANRYHYIGQKIADIWDKELSNHYSKEIKKRYDNKVLVYKNSSVNNIVKIEDVFNKNTNNLENAYLILTYDLTISLKLKKAELQKKFIYIFILVSILVMVLYYLYYVNILKKFSLIQNILSTGKKSDNDIDEIVDNLVKTTRKQMILSNVIKNSNESILVTDENKKIISANTAFETMTGYKEKEVLGLNPKEIFSSHLMDSDFYKKMWKDVKEHGKFQGRVLNRRKDGTNYSAWLNLWVIKDQKSGKIINYVGMSKDISELIKKQEEIDKLIAYDALTGLVSREKFIDVLNKELKEFDKENREFALLYLDIDNFQELNNTLGYEIGDSLLRELSKKFRELLSPNDVISRMGGDEFSIFLSNIDSKDNAFSTANKILNSINDNLFVKNNKIELTMCIGISIFPYDGITSKELISASNIAMKNSKTISKNKITLFQKTMQDEVQKKFIIKQELKNAIKNNELILFYQPKISLKDNMINGFEALIRWEHPTKGFIYPSDFIPVAEESGLIVEMTSWIFKEINNVCERLNSTYNEKFFIAINISAKHFNDKQLLKEIELLIDKKWVSNGYIELEVTESAIMHRLEETKKQLEKIKKMGIKISLDDYGTGHSSLAYLKKLPIDIIKIDKSFVDGICYDNQDYTIIKSTIALAKSLNLKTTIEGVEEKEQLDCVKALGADYVQGYFYSKPLCEEDTRGYLEKWEV